jgi:ferric-dicitrate binding protein FerR (iron transport regulator)
LANVLIAVATSAWALPATAYAADAAGQVQEIKGDAFADTGPQHRTLDQTSLIYVADRVSTGSASRLTMQLGLNTTIKLGENTKLVVDKFLAETGGEISLESGPILVDRPPGARSMPLKIKSQYAVLAVRGTQFFAGPSNGVFGVFVEHGQVDVTAAGVTVTLSPGEGTNLNQPGAPPTAPVRWGQPRIDSAYASIR